MLVGEVGELVPEDEGEQQLAELVGGGEVVGGLEVYQVVVLEEDLLLLKGVPGELFVQALEGLGSLQIHGFAVFEQNQIVEQ